MDSKLAETILADGSVDLIFPSTDDSDPLEIFKSNQRIISFYDEVLHGYILFRASKAISSVKVDLNKMERMVQSLRVHVSGTLCKVQTINSADRNSRLHAQRNPITTPLTNTAQSPQTPHLHQKIKASRSSSAIAPAPPPLALSSLNVDNTRTLTPLMSSIGMANIMSPMNFVPSNARSGLFTSKAEFSIRPTSVIKFLDGEDSATMNTRGTKTPSLSAPSNMNFEVQEDVFYQKQWILAPDQNGVVTGEDFFMAPFQIPISIEKMKGKSPSVDAYLTVKAKIVCLAKNPVLDRNGEQLCDALTHDQTDLLATLRQSISSLPILKIPKSISSPSKNPQQANIASLMAAPKPARRDLSLLPILTPRLKLQWTSPRNLLASIILENKIPPESTEPNPSFLIVNHLNFEVEGFAVTSFDARFEDAALQLLPGEAAISLHQLTILGDENSDRIVAFSVDNNASTASLNSITESECLMQLSMTVTAHIPGMRNQAMATDFFLYADLYSTDHKEIPFKCGKKYKFKDHVSKSISIMANPDSKTCRKINGLSVTFSIASIVRSRQAFSIQVFIVNELKTTCRLRIKIPSRFELLEKNDGFSLKRPVVDEFTFPLRDEEIIRHCLETQQQQSNLVALENNVELKPIRPGGFQSVNLHFMVTMPRLYCLEKIQFEDLDSGRLFELENVLQIHVQ